MKKTIATTKKDSNEIVYVIVGIIILTIASFFFN